MGQAKGVREVGILDCHGGGQVRVEGNFAYIGHIDSNAGTSIVDVTDPKHPQLVVTIQAPKGTHAHKVQVDNGLMLVNREFPPHRPEAPLPGDPPVGVEIFDVSNPRKPRSITTWKSGGRGVHRFTFDGRYAYLSPGMEGYVGNIVFILDVNNPQKPEEAGRWHMPGQWIAGGETPTWKKRDHRHHHSIRVGNRLYTSYWHGGFVILDVTDMSKPRYISGMDWSPPYPWPTHSAVPVPFPIAGRRWMVVADEDVLPIDPEMAPEMAAFMWMLDITDETKPTTVGSFQVDGVNGKRNTEMTGCHQPVELIRGTEIPFAWFAQGLRIVDIGNPHAPREVASYMPDIPAGETRVCSNDVFQDDRGLIYLIDRVRGLSIVERT